ncbi:DUF1176 domain-containing protein [uncultured Massilia sp.]|uniref:DUF1176 domain-containing protein n=1 Tax=uncultured Massilia sp. TaxID=169973 RepID=UPI0025E349CA|nr:DUF1176 domain-containing protein [uncultured Massilia sp.]
MMHRYLFSLLLGTAAIAHAYPRSDLPSVKFEHKDWELVCDNTRTCRAAGYRKETEDPGASILLTRLAGPNQPVRVELQLADDPDHPPPASVRMTIGGRAAGVVRFEGGASVATLSSAQVRALLPALLQDDPIVWTAGKRSWTISTAGANAVLLKMDDFQGRVDTPGALVRTGAKAESSVLPPLPKPVVRATAVPKSQPQQIHLAPAQERQLIAELRKTLSEGDCDLLESDGDEHAPFDIRPLSSDKLLVSHLCWRGAYNTGDGYWVTATKPPYSPVLVTTSATDYKDGTIGATQRGRGIGDCMAASSWVWDGRTFSQTLEQTSGMCRQIAAGGAWDLPTLVADVRRRN